MISTRTQHGPVPEPIDRVPWEELGPQFFEAWGRPNGQVEPEHLTIYGRTGGGKSYFASYVLRERARLRGSHTVVLATKPVDGTISKMGWPVIRKWPPAYDQHQVIYFAGAKNLSPKAREEQRAKVRELLDGLWSPASNTVVYFDEISYVYNNLKLGNELSAFFREGRALGITCVASAQRPVWTGRTTQSEAGWTVAFPSKDAQDRARVCEVLGDRKLYEPAMSSLDSRKHEFLIKSELTGQAYISALPKGV